MSDHLASEGCYGCRGTGKMVGFGCDGRPCPCVAVCENCDEPFAWSHDDERAPRECPSCRRAS